MDLDVVKEVVELDRITGAREDAGIETEIASGDGPVSDSASQRVSRRREVSADMSDYQESDVCQACRAPCEMIAK